MIPKGPITKPIRKDHTVSTEYGLISHHNWLMREKERIEKKSGRRCSIKSIGQNKEILVYG